MVEARATAMVNGMGRMAAVMGTAMATAIAMVMATGIGYR